MDVAKSISEGLARNVISASFNNETVESSTPLATDGSLVLYTWSNDEGKKSFLAFFCAHSSAGLRTVIPWDKTYHWTRYRERILL
jgi:hypothetical protein